MGGGESEDWTFHSTEPPKCQALFSLRELEREAGEGADQMGFRELSLVAAWRRGWSQKAWRQLSKEPLQGPGQRPREAVTIGLISAQTQALRGAP